MKLTKQQFKQLQAALLAAFDVDELTQMVRLELGEDLANVAPGETFNARVFNLILWAERKDRITDLMDGAVTQNPDNNLLSEVCNRTRIAIAASEQIDREVAMTEPDPPSGITQDVVLPASGEFDKGVPAQSAPLLAPPMPAPTRSLMDDPELYAAWAENQKHYHDRRQLWVNQLIDDSRTSYRQLLFMSVLLPLLAVVSFVVAVYAAFYSGPASSLVFGGISIVLFLGYFLIRVNRVAQESSVFRTRLIAAYDGYFQRITNITDLDLAQAEIVEAGRELDSRLRDIHSYARVATK